MLTMQAFHRRLFHFSGTDGLYHRCLVQLTRARHAQMVALNLTWEEW